MMVKQASGLYVYNLLIFNNLRSQPLLWPAKLQIGE